MRKTSNWLFTVYLRLYLIQLQFRFITTFLSYHINNETRSAVQKAISHGQYKKRLTPNNILICWVNKLDLCRCQKRLFGSYTHRQHWAWLLLHAVLLHTEHNRNIQNGTLYLHTKIIRRKVSLVIHKRQKLHFLLDPYSSSKWWYMWIHYLQYGLWL